MLKTPAISAVLSVLSLLGAHLYGRALHLANPNGILFATPPANTEPVRDPAYPLGFMLGGGGTALCVFFAALSFYLSARFFWPEYRQVSSRILVASLVAGVVVAAASMLVQLNYAGGSG